MLICHTWNTVESSIWFLTNRVTIKLTWKLRWIKICVYLVNTIVNIGEVDPKKAPQLLDNETVGYELQIL